MKKPETLSYIAIALSVIAIIMCLFCCMGCKKCKMHHRMGHNGPVPEMMMRGEHAGRPTMHHDGKPGDQHQVKKSEKKHQANKPGKKHQGNKPDADQPRQ